jgi:hypothetical protein
MKKLLLAALLVAAAFAADAGNYTCQIDHSALYATGKTRTDPVTGTILWEYKCPMGHTYWIAPMAPNANYTTPSPPPAPSAPSAPPDYSWLNNAGKQQAEDTGRELGTMLGGAIQGKQVTKLSVILKCNHYHLIDISYGDGSIKVIDDPRAPSGRNEAVDRDKLKALASSLPGFSWGELACDPE